MTEEIVKGMRARSAHDMASRQPRHLRADGGQAADTLKAALKKLGRWTIGIDKRKRCGPGL